MAPDEKALRQAILDYPNAKEKLYTRKNIENTAKNLQREDLLPQKWSKTSKNTLSDQKLTSEILDSIQDAAPNVPLPLLTTIYLRGVKRTHDHALALQRLQDFFNPTLQHPDDSDLAHFAAPQPLIATFGHGQEEHFVEDEHPRGRDGRFIKKGGRIKIFSDLFPDAPPLTGMIEEADVSDPDHIHVRLDSGEHEIFPANLMESSEAKAFLHTGIIPDDITPKTKPEDAHLDTKDTTEGSSYRDDRPEDFPSHLLDSTAYPNLTANGGDGWEPENPPAGPFHLNSTNFLNKDGKRVFVKDTERAEQEEDSARFLREMGHEAPYVEGQDGHVLSTIIGEDKNLQDIDSWFSLFEEKQIEKGQSIDVDMEDLDLKDPDSILQLALSDMLIKNGDRHSGNVLLGRDADDKGYFLPIDHEFSLSTSGGADIDPDGHDLSFQLDDLELAYEHPLNQYVSSHTEEKLKQKVDAFLTDAETTINAIEWRNPENKQTALTQLSAMRNNPQAVIDRLLNGKDAKAELGIKDSLIPTTPEIEKASDDLHEPTPGFLREQADHAYNAEDKAWMSEHESGSGFNGGYQSPQNAKGWMDHLFPDDDITVSSIDPVNIDGVDVGAGAFWRDGHGYFIYTGSETNTRDILHEAAHLKVEQNGEDHYHDEVWAKEYQRLLKDAHFDKVAEDWGKEYGLTDTFKPGISVTLPNGDTGTVVGTNSDGTVVVRLPNGDTKIYDPDSLQL